MHWVKPCYHDLKISSDSLTWCAILFRFTSSNKLTELKYLHMVLGTASILNEQVQVSRPGHHMTSAEPQYSASLVGPEYSSVKEMSR